MHRRDEITEVPSAGLPRPRTPTRFPGSGGTGYSDRAAHQRWQILLNEELDVFGLIECNAIFATSFQSMSFPGEGKDVILKLAATLCSVPHVVFSAP
jgi:hypothetical protein